MLKNLLIFSLFVVAIRASGELTLLNVPSSLSFKDTEPLKSEYVGDVLYAALGNAVSGDVAWTGLYINDPLNLPKRVVAVYVDGARHTAVNDEAKSYALQGSDSEESLSVLSAQLEDSNSDVCNLNLKHLADNSNTAADVFVELFGVAPNVAVSGGNASKQVAYIESIAQNWDNLRRDCEFFLIRTTVDSAEENQAIGAAITKLNDAVQRSNNKNALVVAIANKAARAKRQTEPAVTTTTNTNKYNLGKYYSENYPVIFNIIFWFMVVFFLSLLAICYSLAYMDPGRDSIIYRMTSTRMKKDN